MKLNEFKAWIEGFEEAFTGKYGTGHPNKEQWAKIKDKIALTTDARDVEPFDVGRHMTEISPLMITKDTTDTEQTNE